jgi:4-carboxymuconolactone decarboxylase
MAAVARDTHEALAGISAGRLETLEGALGLREEYRAATGLDERTFALVKIAALIAIDAPPASFAWQVANAVDVGVRPEDILGVLRAIAPRSAGQRSSRPRPRSCWRSACRYPRARSTRSRTSAMRLLMRRRPLLRAAAIGGGAYYMGKRRAEQREFDATQRLDQLGKLHDESVLTDEEFAKLKAQLLNG